MLALNIIYGTGAQSSPSRLRTIFVILALDFFFANGVALTSNAQTTGDPLQAQAVTVPGTDNPEEQIDIKHSDAGIIRMSKPVPIPIVSVQATDDGEAIFKMQPGMMKIVFFNHNIVHVKYSPTDTLPPDPSLGVIAQSTQLQAPFKLGETLNDVTLATDALSVRVNRATGALTFLTSTGVPILAETPNGGKAMQRATVNGEDTYHVQQEFSSPPDEALYGMAEGQDDVWNWRGMPIELISENIVGGTPVMVSSRGYGIVWDNESLTDFNPMSPEQEIPLNASTHVGTFRAERTGIYVFFVSRGSGAGEIGIAVDGKTIHDITNMWVPYTSVATMRLIAGQAYSVKVLAGGEAAKLYGRLLGSTTVFRSETGHDINYYFIYGPQIDKVVAGYRTLTGAAPLFPKWAYGFWQCREHYSSQTQLLDAAGEFRQRQIPVDLIIQDWQYWRKGEWGAYDFDPAAYPDPAGMINRLHQMHLNFMISVWPDPKGPVQDELAQHHGLIDDTGFVNEFYPEARSIRWNYLKQHMFVIGVDAWWQDGEEAWDQVRNHKLYVGSEGYVSGNDYTSAYPQVSNQCIYEGQRATESTKRVVQLGKTCTLGMQRYAAATWSGDIHGNWKSLRAQIPAGLNVSIAGIPYWTTDTGGFFRPADEYTSPDYNRLLIRWFEYSTFCPILRIHGYKTATEMWKWPLAYKYLLMYDNFRYRMLPYIYAEAWRITADGGTLMRPLVMDFQNDPNVHDISDEYMFGSAFMVAPISQPLGRRSVYLPDGTKWINFWTGQSVNGGQHLIVDAPIQQIPLFVRAGAILPLGPVMQYATQSHEDPIEVRVYPGADGAFTIYEDENNGLNYEKGVFATIQFTWNDASKTLTIGQRHGGFPGMLEDRKFLVVIVNPQHGTGLDQTPRPDQIISYSGNPVVVHAAEN